MSEVILYTDEKAAKPHTMKGWVSSKGLFSNSEDSARYDGCTHTICECGKAMPKGYALCNECREKKAIIRHSEREVIEWNGDVIYSERDDKYFSDFDEVDYHCEELETNIDDLRLLSCDGVFASKLEEDYFCDEMCEDQDLPEKLQDAVEAFNKALRGYGQPLSYYPSNKAVKTPKSKVK